jgi:hypothetical protein
VAGAPATTRLFTLTGVGGCGKTSHGLEVARDVADQFPCGADSRYPGSDRLDGAGWSQSIAAQNLGLTQPRVSDLYRGKISKFSLDALVEIASKLGIHVRVEVDTDTVLSA